MGRFIQSSILVLVGLTTLTFFAKAQDWLPRTPSFLLKLLPQPKFEENTLEGSGENGRVIDLIHQRSGGIPVGGCPQFFWGPFGGHIGLLR